MPEKKKSKTHWWVVTLEDETFVRHYGGPDRKRAREVAAKLLAADGKAGISVLKVGSFTVLDSSDMRSVLPKDAF